MSVGQREPRSISALCLLLGYSRQGLYQHQRRLEKQALQADMLLEKVAAYRKQMKRCGGRKLFDLLKEFMEQHAIDMGRDAFFHLLREHGLLVRRRRRKRPITTFSMHWLRKYPNVIIGFIPMVPNQLWVSDITYIAIGENFGYLSLITDHYSHKILGFHLSENLKADGCVIALQMALEQLPLEHSLIHHSDRGVQYCCEKYIALLEQNKVRISMTQTGNPRENPVAERANGILKEEFLFDDHFNDIEQARKRIAEIISIYNHVRPHLSVDMLTPAQAHSRNGELKKRWKNYYSINKAKEVADELA